MAVSFVVDGAVDWVMRKAGYDPAGDVAGKVLGYPQRHRKDVASMVIPKPIELTRNSAPPPGE